MISSHSIGRFCISLEGYHELTQTEGGRDLPRSYLTQGCQASLDSVWNVTWTSRTSPGAELSFKYLLKLQLQRHVNYLIKHHFQFKLPVQ